MTHATPARKGRCYIIRCLGCGRPFEVTRRDVLTCSHRCCDKVGDRNSGKKRRLLAMCKGRGYTLFTVLQWAAIELLRPDLIELWEAGELTLDEAQALLIGSNGRVNAKGYKGA
jgi:hypothetical protein